jgi:hypothetical protein
MIPQFRIRDKVKKIWLNEIHSLYYSQQGSLYRVDEEVNKGILEHDDITRLCFQIKSPFIDKDGEELYEGDIIKDSEETYVLELGEFHHDEYTYYGWRYYNIKNKAVQGGVSPEDWIVMKKLGNIFDNPELMK